MHPKSHIILGAIFVIIFYFSFESITFIPALIIWISSWLLIDLDHPLCYVVKTGNFNPRSFWKWSNNRKIRWKKVSRKERRKFKLPLFLFHNIETLIVLFLFSSFYPFVFWIFVGFVFHLFLDQIDILINRENVFIKFSLLVLFLYNLDRKEFE